jgi:Arc/MetJ family transcription regulator
MRTTIDIDDNLLKEAMKETSSTTKKDVVEEALAELIRARRIEKLRRMIGTYEIGITPEELRRMRGK